MVYLTGDTHGDVISRVSKRNCKKNNLPILQNGDILIVLGDLGLVWSDKADATLKYTNKYLKDRNITLLSVLGNHENYDRIENLPQTNFYGGKVYRVSSNISFMKNGELFNIEGIKFAVFGGAKSIDKVYRKEGVSWWSQEIPSKDTMEYFVKNLDKINTEEYYLLTHTTNYDQVKRILWHDSPKLDDVSRFLEFIKYQYRFKHHYFGHFHSDREYENSTLLYESIVVLDKEVI